MIIKKKNTETWIKYMKYIYPISKWQKSFEYDHFTSVKSNELIELNLSPSVREPSQWMNSFLGASKRRRGSYTKLGNTCIYKHVFLCLSFIIYRLLSEYRRHEDFISRPSVDVLCVRGKHCLSGGWLLITQLVGSLVLARRKGDYNSVLFVISLLLIITRILRNLYLLLKLSYIKNFSEGNYNSKITRNLLIF